MCDKNNNDTVTTPEKKLGIKPPPLTPVLLVAHSPVNHQSVDRFEIGIDFSVGRKPPAQCQLQDEWLSKVHFSIARHDGDFYVNDLDSTNGVFVNGLPLVGRQRLKDASLIRAGRTLFVFYRDGESLLQHSPLSSHGITGPFHVAPLLDHLKHVADARSQVLLVGATGSGKELAAHALSKLADRELLVHNAAKFGTEEELVSTLFGVGEGVFTGVEKRIGLIEHADGKMLFLDEAHHLPLRIQKSLLRVVEDWQVSSIGEINNRRVDVRFVFASNVSEEPYGLAGDLLARLRVVKIPPLNERIADIPCIFNKILADRLKETSSGYSDDLGFITTDHYESLCIDGFPKENAREIIKIAWDIADRIVSGVEPEAAANKVFYARYKNSPVYLRNSEENRFKTSRTKEEERSHNGKNTAEDSLSSVWKKVNLDAATGALIKDAYYDCRGVVADMALLLNETHDLKISRRRISKIVDALNLPRLKRRRA